MEVDLQRSFRSAGRFGCILKRFFFEGERLDRFARTRRQLGDEGMQLRCLRARYRLAFGIILACLRLECFGRMDLPNTLPAAFAENVDCPPLGDRGQP